MAMRTPASLFQGRFSWESPSGTVAGVVTLNRLKLRFEPRAFGVGPDGARSLALSDVADVRFEADLGQVVLQLEDGSEHRLAGDGASNLARELARLIVEEGEQSIQPESEETQLLRVEVDLRYNGLLSTRAVCELMPSSLRVVQVPGLQARLLRVETLHCRYQDITHAEMDGARSLTLSVDDRTVVLRGGAIPRIFAMIHAARLSGLESPNMNRAPTPIKRVTGPREIPGFISFGPSHYVFTPEGLIDAAVGSESSEMAWEDIEEAELRGRDRERLRIVGRGEVQEYQLKDSAQSWASLKRLIRKRYPLEPVPGVGTRRFSAPMMAGFLAPWKMALQGDEQPLWLRFCLRRMEGQRVVPAWLLMTDRAVYYLTSTQTAKEGLRVEMSAVSSLRTWADDEPTIRLSLGGDLYDLEPPLGAADVRQFWSLNPLTSYQGPRDRPVSIFAMPKLEGAPHFLRMTVRERELLRVSLPELRAEKDGLVVLYTPGQRSGDGVPAEAIVDVVDGRGVFRFLGLLMAEGQERSRDGGVNLRYFKLAVVTKPERVSKREEYRVLVDLPATLHVLDADPDDPGVAGQLCDVSAGGLCVNSELKVPDNEPIRVRFTLEGEPVEVIGQRVNEKKLGEPANQWQQGIQLSGTSVEVITHLRQLLIHLQRRSAASERDDEPT